jgi:hypothetical protein
MPADIAIKSGEIERVYALPLHFMLIACLGRAYKNGTLTIGLHLIFTPIP